METKTERVEKGESYIRREEMAETYVGKLQKYKLICFDFIHVQSIPFPTSEEDKVFTVKKAGGEKYGRRSDLSNL